MNERKTALMEAAAYVLLPNANADKGYTPERRGKIAQELVQTALQVEYGAYGDMSCAIVKD